MKNYSETVISNPEEIVHFFNPSQHKRVQMEIDQCKQAIAKGHDFCVSTYYLENVIRNNINHPLLRVILPQIDDLNVIAETGIHCSDNTVKIVDSRYWIQKYMANGILLCTNKCLQRCVYCFRKKSENPSEIPLEEIDKIFHEISANDPHENLIEIILSGGDPLTCRSETLRQIAENLSKLNSIRQNPLMLDIHTRQPVVAPHTVLRSEILNVIAELQPSSIDLHIIHPDEITDGFEKVCQALQGINPRISLRTIHPFLKGINDSSGILIEMYRKLGNLDVFPRDIILTIPGGAAPSLRVDLDTAMKIMRELRKYLPGHLLPNLVVCSPSHGKCYVDPHHLKENGEFGYDIRDGLIQGLFIKDSEKKQQISLFANL